MDLTWSELQQLSYLQHLHLTHHTYTNTFLGRIFSCFGKKKMRTTMLWLFFTEKHSSVTSIHAALVLLPQSQYSLLASCPWAGEHTCLWQYHIWNVKVQVLGSELQLEFSANLRIHLFYSTASVESGQKLP